MTIEEAKAIIHNPHKQFVLYALIYYVNLNDNELNTLVLRHMRGITQEECAELLNRSVNTIKRWEKNALNKCAAAWDKNKKLNNLFYSDDKDK